MPLYCYVEMPLYCYVEMPLYCYVEMPLYCYVEMPLYCRTQINKGLRIKFLHYFVTFCAYLGHLCQSDIAELKYQRKYVYIYALFVSNYRSPIHIHNYIIEIILLCLPGRHLLWHTGIRWNNLKLLFVDEQTGMLQISTIMYTPGA